MFKRSRLLVGFIGFVAVMGLFCFPRATAQTNVSMGFFQGRGIAQGAVFSRGQNAHVTLTLDGNNFSLEMTEPPRTDTQTQSRSPTRIQYRGAISRRDNENNDVSSFTLNTRVRSFDSSETLRVITNTTGTCRIEVFAARVVHSNCKTAARNSSIRFLGLEQF
jgi:hypothetical protein